MVRNSNITDCNAYSQEQKNLLKGIKLSLLTSLLLLWEENKKEQKRHN